MKLRFSPLGKQRVKRYCKRLSMDTGLDWEMVVNYPEKPAAGI